MTRRSASPIALVFLIFASTASGGDRKIGDIHFLPSEQGEVTFSHRFHAGLKNIPCEYCHARIRKMKEAAREKKEKFSHMKVCITCHDGSAAFKTENNCGRCHTQGAGKDHGTASHH